MNREQTAEQLIDLFHLLKKRLIRYAAHHVKHGISPMQLHIMFSMLEKEVFTMSELANVVLISKQQLTPLVDKLVSSGLILREHDAADRRVVRVRLSPAGTVFLTTHKQEVVRVFDTKLASLDSDDRIRLNAALAELKQIIQKLP